MRPATHWRVLDRLYLYKLHTVRPYLTAVSKEQDVWYDQFIDLENSRLIDAQIGDRDVELSKVIKFGHGRMSQAILKKIRVHLTARGLSVVLDDPGNQIRYTLGQHGKSLGLDRLFVDNDIVFDDIVRTQRLGHIKITFLDDPEEIELESSYRLAASLFAAGLTARGREYLPR